MRSSMRRATVLALGCCIAFVVLAVLVATGTTRGPDSAVLERLRPEDAWGEAQVRYSPWMHRLDPVRTLALLAVTSGAVALLRRSWGPLLTAAVIGGSTVLLTVGSKALLGRPDPHGFLTESGGSFPSGHMAALVASLGGCVLVAWPRGPWWRWTPVVAGAGLLGLSQLVSAAHWPSDLVGGALLALVVLGVVSGLGARSTGAQPTGATGAESRPEPSEESRKPSSLGATTSAS